MTRADATQLVNISDMRWRLGDDEELIAELFRVFLEEYSAQLATLKSAVDSRDAAAVRRAAHVIKSSVGNLSAARAVGSVADLEDAAEQQSVTTFDDQFAAVDENIRALAAELHARLGAS